MQMASLAPSDSAFEQDAGESLRVCVRVRPLSQREASQHSTSCIEVTGQSVLQLRRPGASREFTFHQLFDVNSSQAQVFQETGIASLLDSALEGYSVTVFAYGQTGSGKTYTIAGLEEHLGRSDYTSDDSDGLVPRAVTYLWQSMAQRTGRYFVKSGFFEIYNEQVRDLLNPSSGVLHCRWNAQKGFYVEDLLIVDCTSIDDLIAVLHEGMRNRKSGSHELNPDSSRSHSILMIYFISEIVSDDGHALKQYGKVYFVDLAGSERLKETKSSDGMLNETKSINRSLFVLGKVISALSDRKTRSHVPYRDSKLTMVLMDSLGGASRALMIACVSPASAYIEETASTLHYAARAMNIRNLPLLQVDSNEHMIFNLKREVQLLRLQNEYLKEQLARTAGGLPPLMVDYANKTAQGVQGAYAKVSSLRDENAKIREANEYSKNQYQKCMMHNQELYLKLENLENAFVGTPATREEKGPRQARTVSALVNENATLKKRLRTVQQGRDSPMNQEGGDAATARGLNEDLQRQVERLQRRERELLENLQKFQRRK